MQNQVDALAKHDIKIGVVGVYNISLKEALKTENINKFGFYKEECDNVTKYTHLYPVLPKQHYLNHRIKFKIWKNLFKKYIKDQGKPELVHLHTFEAGEIAIWIKEQYDIPYIVTEHTTLFFTNKALKWHLKLAAKVYKQSNLNIAVSNSSARDLNNRFHQEFYYFPNFVDITKFEMLDYNSKEKKIFTNIAFLDPKKNQLMLIQAFNKAFNNDSNYKLQIIGNGKELNNLKNEIDKLSNTNIYLLGYLPQNQIVKHLQNSDYFVLSSDYETFGVVIIEAMSCGLPILSTACGGPESIIENEKVGLLSPVGNVDLFAHNLQKLSDTEYDRKYIRYYAVNSFSFEVLSQKLLDLYERFI